jgi:hypothetical protein
MNYPHLIEFMDQSWLPQSLRNTLREILECGNSWPFRRYYDWVAKQVLKTAADEGYGSIVELGAGSAPITKRLARSRNSEGRQLVVCDEYPDTELFRELKAQYPNKVAPIFEKVDFSKPMDWDPGTLLVLSGAFHHIAPQGRAEVLRSLTSSADKTMMCEPLRRNFCSFALIWGSLFPALLLPLLYLGKTGRMRRFFWCWLLPVAPVVFVWDGLVSCLREWTEEEWTRELQDNLKRKVTPSIQTSLFSQMVVWGEPRVSKTAHLSRN